MAPVPPLTVNIPATLRMMSELLLIAATPWSYLKHTFWSSPSRQLASKPNPNDLWCLQFPWKISHNVDSVSTADTNGSHSKTSGIWCMGISTNHQATRESIILENNLMNDTGARFPEANVIFGTSCR